MDILCGVLFIYIGLLVFKYRNEIGAFTDYYVGHGRWVDKPTPGWMLIPFALVLIAAGLIALYSIFSPEPAYVPYHSRLPVQEFPTDLMK
jgi:hypothetical protein